MSNSNFREKKLYRKHLYCR